MAALCSSKELCADDIYKKLRLAKCTQEDAAEIVNYLIKRNYLNEQRFADAFVSDKFKIQHWGKIKIAHALKQKKIRSEIIQGALNSIDIDEYLETLQKEIDKKIKQEKGELSAVVKAKVLRSLAAKGFEGELIMRMLGDLGDE